MAPISIHSVHFSFWYQKEWWKITFHISSKWLWFRSFVLPFCLISITKSVFKKLKRDNYSILSLCMFEKLFDKPGKTAKIRNADNGFISCSGACKLWALCPPLPSICERCVPPPLFSRPWWSSCWGSTSQRSTPCSSQNTCQVRNFVLPSASDFT